MLSYGEGLVLINFVVTSLPIFLLSLFEIAKEVNKKKWISIGLVSFGRVMT
jgi:hypothetical protein